MQLLAHSSFANTITKGALANWSRRGMAKLYLSIGNLSSKQTHLYPLSIGISCLAQPSLAWH